MQVPGEHGWLTTMLAPVPSTMSTFVRLTTLATVMLTVAVMVTTNACCVPAGIASSTASRVVVHRSTLQHAAAVRTRDSCGLVCRRVEEAEADSGRRTVHSPGSTVPSYAVPRATFVTCAFVVSNTTSACAALVVDVDVVLTATVKLLPARTVGDDGEMVNVPSSWRRRLPARERQRQRHDADSEHSEPARR